MNHNEDIKYTQKRYSDIIQLLLEICRVIESKDSPDDILKPVLLMLSDFWEIEDGAFTIFNKEKNEVYVDIALGLSEPQQMKGRYKTGEGITGEVVKTGKIKIVPQVTLEPNFLSKTKSRTKREYSFVCVPIVYNKEITGTLSVTLPYKQDNNLTMVSDTLTIITSLVSQPLMLKKQLLETEQKIKNIESQVSNDKSNAITGNSKNMRTQKVKLYTYSKTEDAILITGERGTGKTFWAHVLHQTSIRKDKPLIQYTCNATTQDLQLATLFGITNSATSESKNDNSLLKQAENGTLLIEDVEFLSQKAQEPILDILQHNQLLINGNIEKYFARFIFTSSENLQEAVLNNSLNTSLYKIMSANEIRLPTLKERKDDIVLLADQILQEASHKQQKNIKRFSTPAIDLLCSYHWPGNLNEMQQVISHCVRTCKGGVIHAHMLPPSLQSAQSTNTVEQQGLHEAVAQIEKDLIIDALKITRGNMAKSAKLLKISDRIFGLRIKKYGIAPSQYR